MVVLYMACTSCGIVTDKQKSEPHPDAIATEEAARHADEDLVDKSIPDTFSYPSVVVGNLEIMTGNASLRDGRYTYDTFDWYEAIKVPNAFGNGWRLPTKDELTILFDNREKIGGFKKTDSYRREDYGILGYWSSTEFGGNEAWYYSFDIGQCNDDAYENYGERRSCGHYTHDMPGTYSKKEPKYVRLVRNVSGNRADTGFDEGRESFGLLTDPWLVSSSESKDANITATGSGSTPDEAQRMALRNAIEQAFGAFISSKTEIFNNMVVADQMASVSRDNVKSFKVLNREQLPDGKWTVVLRALISVDKLTSFAKAKGVSVDVQGGLFAMNIKQQMLNEQSEMDVVYNMAGQLHEVMQTAFDYEIENGGPASMDGQSQNWEIPLRVTATANKNTEFCAQYLMKTLAGLSLSRVEREDYKKLNKYIFKVAITYAGGTQVYYLRNMVSINCLLTFASDFRFYTQLYAVNSGSSEKYGNEQVFVVANSREVGREYTEFGDVSVYMDPTLRLSLPSMGDLVAMFNWRDRININESGNLNQYSVKPRGIISEFKEGGYLLKERMGYFDGIELSDNNVIEFVHPNSPAASIGLQIGDSIMTSDGKEMNALLRRKFGFTAIGLNQKLEVKKRDSGNIVTLALKPKKATYGLVVGLCDFGKHYQYSTTSKRLCYLPVANQIDANEIAESSKFGGVQGWRLPTFQEAKEIYSKPLIFNQREDAYGQLTWRHCGGWLVGDYHAAGTGFTFNHNYYKKCGHPSVNYYGKKNCRPSDLQHGVRPNRIRPVRTFVIFN